VSYEVTRPRESTTIFRENRLEDKIQELEKQLFDNRIEKKEILRKYDELKKRYNSLSSKYNSLLCEVANEKGAKYGTKKIL